MKREKILATLVVILLSMICLGILLTPDLFSESQPFELRINVGGERIIDFRGREWLKDHIYRSGHGYLGISGTFTSREEIKATSIPEIYQSERYKLFGYRIDVPNGHYEIVLHFAEIYHDRRGKRLMEIKIEDIVVEKSLDIFRRVGKNTALVLTYNTQELGQPISDNCIDIEFINKRDDTKLSGIEIIQMTEQPSLLKVEPEELDFGLKQNSIRVRISNIGVIPVLWRLNKSDYTTWLKKPKPNTGRLDPDDYISIPIEINRSQAQGGIIRDTLSLVCSDFKKKIPVSVTVKGASRLNIISSSVDFKAKHKNLTCVLRNDGGSTLDWSINTDGSPTWIRRIYPSSGSLEIGETAFINISVSRKNLPEGTHTQSISVISDAERQNISLSVTVPPRKKSIIFVNEKATGNNTGLSWEHAFKNIHDALKSVRRTGNGRSVEIWVARGTYHEHDMVIPTGVEIYGGFCGDEGTREERSDPWIYPTIVDAGRKGRCFECFHRTVIDGFIIQNGRDWNEGEGKGAAILTYDADVKIRNNFIRNNVDSWAGALFVDGFNRRRKVANASPLIEYNVFTNNFSNYCAAAIEIRGSAATIRNNTIIGNKGFGLEIQDLTGPYREITYGSFYNNIITNNVRHKQNDVWAEARKSTNYSYVGKCWNLVGKFQPYDYGTGNIFGDVSSPDIGFIDMDGGDYHLTENSPCIDTGHPDAGMDSDGSRADMGAFPFDKDGCNLDFSPQHLHFTPDRNINTVKIKAYGGKPVEWQVNAFPMNDIFITIKPNSGVLKNGEEAIVTFSHIPTGLEDGMYEGYFVFSTADKGFEGTLSLLVNNSSPELETDRDEIIVDAEIDGHNPTPQRIQVNNAGYGRLTWKTSERYNVPWLDFSELSGINMNVITLTFNTARMKFGEYYEELIISSPEAVNKSVTLPVRLRMKPPVFVQEIEAERTGSLPNSAWQILTNDGARCIQALENSISAQDDVTRLDYNFTVPADVEFVYVFAEVDANDSRSNDSFWVTVNGYDPCLWDHINAKTDGWKRSWVYNQKRDKQHIFVVKPGKNKLNVYCREQGGSINWFVITNNPNMNINTYQFGSNSKYSRRR